MQNKNFYKYFTQNIWSTGLIDFKMPGFHPQLLTVPLNDGITPIQSSTFWSNICECTRSKNSVLKKSWIRKILTLITSVWDVMVWTNVHWVRNASSFPRPHVPVSFSSFSKNYRFTISHAIFIKRILRARDYLHSPLFCYK